MSFVHLHTHSEYSMLDSTLRISHLVERAKEDEAPAIALTDHSNMFGAVEFFKAAKASGIKPIFGAEVQIVPGDRTDPGQRRSYALVLLCKNQTGYRNLCYLLSRAWMDQPLRAPAPRIDRKLLGERAQGLIGLSAGLGGEIGQALLRGTLEEAERIARFYLGAFGPGAFYLEIQRNGLREQELVNPRLLELAAHLSLPLVAGADAHYRTPADAGAHEVLMCIQLGKSLPSLEHKARLTDGLHLAPASEMVERFHDLPEAVENTLAIAQACEMTLELGKTYLPSFQVPPGYEPAGYLAEMAGEGLAARLREVSANGRTPDEPVYRERLARELGIIAQMGFPGYFLIVWDFIRYAREQGIPVGPGRGSGAGSLVAWSLRITDLDPLRYGLLFERFLNPERVSMPDFDIDFCMNQRDRVIQYVVRKYGEDQVGQIITYGTMKAKAVVRDVARVLGLSYAEADRAAKLIPGDLGMTLELAFKAEPRLGELRKEDPRYDKLFETALALEGLARQPGMHAAGVVIADRPLWEYVPLYAVRNEDGSVVRITQYAKDEVEEAGLVKFDFLGLKTLTVVDQAMRLANETRRVQGEPPLQLAGLPLDDPKVFELMASGDTTGIFQLESSGFKDLMRKLRPDCVEDVIAAVALYRPGPLQSGMVDSFVRRKHGEEAVAYPHPMLEGTLRETYGVMVYQEQVMQAASVLAGYSLGQADILRRAMGKKKPSEMAKQRESFIAGAVERGVAAAQAGEIFETIEKFAGYGFNKSHSAAYGLISYQTAWLKTHYPVEFMAANLTADGDNTDKIVRFIADARAMGITVMPPSVDESEADFTPITAAELPPPRSPAAEPARPPPHRQGRIRFGLGAIKGIGSGAVEAILAARADGGPFKSLFEFCERVDLRRVNRRVMEALVKSGALGGFGLPRATLWGSLDKAMDRGQQVQRDRASGQFDMFGALSVAAGPRTSPDALVAGEEWPDKLRLAYEKDCLGFYVSGHPLDGYAADMRRLGAVPLGKIQEQEDRAKVTVAGVVAEMRQRPLKSGQGHMAFLHLEDTTGQVEVVVFSKTFQAGEAALKGDGPITLEATVQHEGDPENRVVRLRAESVQTLAEYRQRATQRVRFSLDAGLVGEDLLSRLAQVLGSSETGLPVEVRLEVPGAGTAELRLGDRFRAAIDDETLGRLERVVGRGRVSCV
jgi:DNA polymerase-3 subunit alpha